MIVDIRGCGRTGQRSGANNVLKGCDGSITDRRVGIQVSVQCVLLFAQPAENILESVLEHKTDDRVGLRPFQILELTVCYLRVLDLNSCLNPSSKSPVPESGSVINDCIS
jgi:hypothetical protein